MPEINIGTICLNYETYGDPTKVPILLLHGLGDQLTTWPLTFRTELANSGYVVAFDQRDAGLSTEMGPCFEPDLPSDWDGAAAYAQSHPVPYTLFDMADDVMQAARLMGFDHYHIVGHSMGGMIAQIIAATDRERVLSLTSLCSSGGQALFRPDPSALPGMKAYLSSYEDVETAVAARVAGLTAAMDQPSEQTLQDLASFIRAELDRSYYPGGNLRHFWAVAASGDRTELLQKIQCPTLAILGGEDKVIPPEFGAHLAQLVQDCELRVFETMRHAFLDSEVGPVLSNMRRLLNN